MEGFNFLTALFDVEPNSSPFISVYLNTEPNETGKKDFGVFLKKQFSDHTAVLAEGSTERREFEELGEKVQAFTEDLDPATRGLAVFARGGDSEFFRAFQFPVPFEENKFYSFDRPFVFPLVRLASDNPTYAVVAADTNRAHIYVVKRSEIVKLDEIQNEKTNRSEVGGWSQARYQRHIENFHQQHAKEVVQELEKIVRDSRIEHVILIGDQAVIIPLLREQMSEELSKRIVDSLPMNVNSPEHEIAEATAEAMSRYRTEAEKEKIAALMEENYADGRGVTGFEKTLAALFNGQVQELYLSGDLDSILYRSGDAKVLLKDYEPGIDESLPDASEKEFMVDYLIKQAAASADRIVFIQDEHLLKTVGGVGAFLRYQAKGVTNQ